ncbi:MAG: UDP-N-acetylmuramate dehydrogenase [Pseudohongiellaceae bacterium]
MQKNFDLQAHNTFGLSVRARYFCEAASVQQCRDALQFARAADLPLLVLGGGSNVLFREDYPGIVLHMTSRGIDVINESAGTVLVRAAGGENWHGFVQHCLHTGMHGLENLALIPGCVGAAPIQNIGAYGVEVKDLITAVEVLDVTTGEIAELSREQCEFGYRDSIFKRGLRGRKIILSATFRLRREPLVNVSYAALAQAVSHIVDPQPQQVFDAVCAIRRSKLPDPAALGNAGSFFKNPVISRELFERVARDWPGLPAFPVGDAPHTSVVRDRVKVPAAWLIEKAGWKGRKLGNAGVYQLQPLVLVNHGGASAIDITSLAEQVMASVERKFGIRLEPEVQWIPPRSLD